MIPYIIIGCLIVYILKDKIIDIAKKKGAKSDSILLFASYTITTVAAIALVYITCYSVYILWHPTIMSEGPAFLMAVSLLPGIAVHVAAIICIIACICMSIGRVIEHQKNFWERCK